MDYLYRAVAIAIASIGIFGGLGLMFHGFNLVTIHKHYHNDKN